MMRSLISEINLIKNVLNEIPDHVYWLDLDNKFLGCNKKQAESFSLNDPNEIVGRSIYEFEPKENADHIVAINNKVITTKSEILAEEPFEQPDGSVLIFISKKAPLFNEKDEIIGTIGVSIDITAKKKINEYKLEKLQLEKEKAEETSVIMSFYEMILDLIPGHIFWQDLNGVYLGSNKQQALTAGYIDKKDIIGKTDYDLPWSHQAEYLRKNNELVIKSGSLHTIEEDFEILGVRKGTYLSKKQPLKDEHGNIVGLLGVSFDISAEKENQHLQMEKLKLEKEAAERKAELMEILAGAMAHELRTPLGALSAYAQGINMHLPKLLGVYKIAKEANLDLPYIGKQQLDAMSQSAESIQTEVRSGFHFINMLLKNIQQDLRDYSFEPTSLKHCIEMAIERYPVQLSQQHIIKTDLQKDVIFNGNADLMIYVFFNLLKNALFYVGTATDAEILIQIPAGKENKVIFRDNGSGISPEVLPHIFEKFYSKSRHGTGIGLAFCQMVIQNFDGLISCESELREYTEFVIQFPQT